MRVWGSVVELALASAIIACRQLPEGGCVSEYRTRTMALLPMPKSPKMQEKSASVFSVVQVPRFVVTEWANCKTLFEFGQER